MVDWGSAFSRGLGRSMDGGEGAVRYERVYVRKRRSSLAARRARSQKGTRIALIVFFIEDSGFGSAFLVGYFK